MLLQLCIIMVKSPGLIRLFAVIISSNLQSFTTVTDYWPVLKHVSRGLKTSQNIADILNVAILWATAEADPRLIEFLKSPKVRL